MKNFDCGEIFDGALIILWWWDIGYENIFFFGKCGFWLRGFWLWKLMS